MQGQGNQGYERIGTRLKAKVGAALNIVLTDFLDSGGLPVDLTGATVEMVLQASEPLPTTSPLPPYDTAEYQYGSDSEITVSASQILIEIPASSTKTYSQDVYYYDMFIRFPSGEPQALMSGMLLVEGSGIREMSI